MSAADVAIVREHTIYHISAGLELEQAVERALDDTNLNAGTTNGTLIKHLVTKGLEGRRCDVCRGELIGTELAFGTCGHCGGRSINPTTKEEVNP